MKGSLQNGIKSCYRNNAKDDSGTIAVRLKALKRARKRTMKRVMKRALKRVMKRVMKRAIKSPCGALSP